MLNSSIVMTPRTRGLPVAGVSLPVLPVLAMAVSVLPLLAPSQAQAATYHGDYEFWLPGNPRTTITSVTKFATNVQGAQITKVTNDSPYTVELGWSNDGLYYYRSAVLSPGGSTTVFNGLSPNTTWVGAPLDRNWSGGVLARPPATGPFTVDWKHDKAPEPKPAPEPRPASWAYTAFQANTGNLWVVENGTGRDLGLGMMRGTNPSVAGLHDGKPVTGFQANTGNLWVVENGTGRDLGLGMMRGTSPSIAKRNRFN